MGILVIEKRIAKENKRIKKSALRKFRSHFEDYFKRKLSLWSKDILILKKCNSSYWLLKAILSIELASWLVNTLFTS